MTETPPDNRPWPPAAARQKPSALASAALALGICSFVCHPVGLVLGVAGIVLGIVALVKNAGGHDRAASGIVLGIVGIVIVQGWLVRELTLSREVARRALCGGNLNGIGKGIAMYATENQDAYPPNLQVLITEGSVSPRMLQCPSAGGNRPCDYYYLAPAGEPAEDPADVPRDLLLACDLRGNHGDVRNVLYASWRVKRLSEEEFQAELAKPVNAAFAAALRKAEGELQRGN